jgi:hypothetical protein
MGKGDLEGREGRSTRRGFSTSPRMGLDDPDTVPDAQAPAEGPSIHVEIVEEKGTPRLLEGRWRAYEVWTAQHVYVLADDLVCFEIIDRRTGRAEPDNEITGARLVGGALRDRRGKIRKVFHPLPQRGARAVFAKAVGERQRMSETSPVTRVVLRQRVVSFTSGDSDPHLSWKGITGRHELP